MATTSAVRKTKKWYRDQITKDYATACKVFREAFLKYGVKHVYPYVCRKGTYTNVEYSTKKYVHNGHRGTITGFSAYPTRGAQCKVWVDGYIVGDKTDSSESVDLNEFIKNGSARIGLTETFRNGDSQTIHTHFTKDHLYQMMKNFAEDMLK